MSILRRICIETIPAPFPYLLLYLFALSYAGCSGQETLNLFPEITGVTPATVIAGSGDLAITISGEAFTRQSVVSADGTALATTFVSANKLIASLPLSFLASPGIIDLAVRDPKLGDGATRSISFTVLDVGVVSSTNNSQVARYSFTSPVDATVTIEFGLTTDYGFRTWSKAIPPGGKVDILVAGMRAFSEYHMRARVDLPGGVIHYDRDHRFTTRGLGPEKIPTMTVTQSAELVPESGVQLLDAARGDPGTRALVIDLNGNVIWFYERPELAVALGFLPNGHFVTLERGPSAVREVDLAGDTVRFITADELNQSLMAKGMEPVAGGAFHHDAIMLPNGHLLLVTNYTKSFTDVAGFEGQTIEVLGDGLVELDEDLEPVWVWSAFDHLDVNRHPRTFPDRFGRFDWTHANAVTYSPADGNLLLSPRSQHWVIKIDYRDGFGTGDILWKLGPGGDMTLINGGQEDWHYAQHFPFIIDNQIGVFRLAVFDNGNNRPTDESGTFCEDDPEQECFSRVVLYEIDEGMKTARLVWEDKFPFFSTALGSVQVFENGNVLYAAGAIGGASALTALVREETQEEIPQLIWELNLSGQLVYRSFRLPSLYPGVHW